MVIVGAKFYYLSFLYFLNNVIAITTNGLGDSIAGKMNL